MDVEILYVFNEKRLHTTRHLNGYYGNIYTVTKNGAPVIFFTFYNSTLEMDMCVCVCVCVYRLPEALSTIGESNGNNFDI